MIEIKEVRQTCMDIYNDARRRMITDIEHECFDDIDMLLSRYYKQICESHDTAENVSIKKKVREQALDSCKKNIQVYANNKYTECVGRCLAFVDDRPEEEAKEIMAFFESYIKAAISEDARLIMADCRQEFNKAFGRILPPRCKSCHG